MTFEEWIKKQPNGHYLSADIFAAGAASRDAEVAELVAALERIRDEPAESDTCDGIEPHVIASEALAKVRKP